MLVAIGDNCIDRYLPPLALERVGGNAVNVAAVIATHGYASAYVGVVGDDDAGTRVIETLKAAGVNVDHVVRTPGPTGLTEIQLQGGEYAIRLERYGVSDQVDVTDDLRRFLATHAARIHLTVTGRATRLIQPLRAVSVPISVDLGIVRSGTDLDRFEHLLPCISEAFLSTGSGLEDAVVEAILRKATLLGARSVVATRGERGCMAWQNGTLSALASQIAPRDIVDPLGAGDAFIAGFLSSLSDESSRDASTTVHSLLTASTWAAQACQQIGGWPEAGP